MENGNYVAVVGSHVEVLRNIPVNFDVRSVMLGGDWPQMYVHTGFYTCTGSVVFVHVFTRCLWPTLSQGLLLGPGGSGEQGDRVCVPRILLDRDGAGLSSPLMSSKDHCDPR